MMMARRCLSLLNKGGFLFILQILEMVVYTIAQGRVACFPSSLLFILCMSLASRPQGGGSYSKKPTVQVQLHTDPTYWLCVSSSVILRSTHHRVETYAMRSRGVNEDTPNGQKYPLTPNRGDSSGEKEAPQ